MGRIIPTLERTGLAIARRKIVGWLMRRWLGVSVAVVFRDRAALEAAYPTSETFHGRERDTYGLWLSGLGVLSTLDPATHNIRQLVLPHPDTPYLSALERASGLSLDIVGNVRRQTENARGLGVEVYWYQGWPGVAVTIQNPGTGNGWVHVEAIVPGHFPSGRPVFRLEEKQNPQVLDRYWEAYQELVASSELAPTDGT